MALANQEKSLRALWQECAASNGGEEIDVFFDELYDAAATRVVATDDVALASGQWSEHKMNFAGASINVGIVQGLKISPALKTAERRVAMGELLAQLHQDQWKKGEMLSVIVPQNAKERQLLEEFGYTTASYRLAAASNLPEKFETDDKIEVREETEWGREIWLFYSRNAGIHPFEIRLTEGDFYAMLAQHDLEGGVVLTARRFGRIVGFSLVVKEGKPLKNGKASTKQHRLNMRYVLAYDETVLRTMQHYAMVQHPDCKQMVIVGGCPAKGFGGAQPYAMFRVICAKKFLDFVGHRLPGLQLSVTLKGDKDIADNNNSFRLRDGRCYVGLLEYDSVMGPGGVPAMLLSGQPVQFPGL